jgi:hypothetical protein
VISKPIYLPATGSWSNWRSNTFSDVRIPAGETKLKVRFIRGGANFNYLRFTNLRPTGMDSFNAISAETSALKNKIHIHLNDDAIPGDIETGEFQLKIGNNPAGLVSARIFADRPRVIEIIPEMFFNRDQSITISYTGKSIQSGDLVLEAFTELDVVNGADSFYLPPVRIQAENYLRNKGFALEECEDGGGGKNTGYAHVGDYLEYPVIVNSGGLYNLSFRVALANGDAGISLSIVKDGLPQKIKNITLNNTGGWQTWKTQSLSLNLPAGKHILRITSEYQAFNMNWFQLDPLQTSTPLTFQPEPKIYPNPADQFLNVELDRLPEKEILLEIYDIRGSKVFQGLTDQRINLIDTTGFESGVYFLNIQTHEGPKTYKLMIN